MKWLIYMLAPAFFIMMSSCSGADNTARDTLVLIKTEFGNITVKLYDETPEHKANFLKLVNEDFYNGLLFHRVIADFMIQGGDPDSRNAQPGQRLGGGSLDYTIPAEFVPALYHKRGALAAARRGDSMNREKRSSASQFYIVQGEVYNDAELDTVEMIKNAKVKQNIWQNELSKYGEKFNRYKADNQRDSFEVLYIKVRELSDSLYEAAEKFKFPENQRNEYKTVGGYPSLDGDYTVFGEVIEGMDVVDKIAAVETDKNNRPLKDIKMEVELVK